VLFEHALLYDATIHVPLIISDAGQKARGRSDEIVQHHDIVPTLLHIAGVPWNGYTSGHVLAPYSPNAEKRDFAVSLQDGGSALRCLRTASRKLICHLDPDQGPFSEPARVERFELYDLLADPHELSDVHAAHPDEVSALAQQLDDWRANILAGTARGDPLLDPELRVDFRKYPGDPVLVEFYGSLAALGPRGDPR
jgi:arylsulfatase A-like enzyme